VDKKRKIMKKYTLCLLVYAVLPIMAAGCIPQVQQQAKIIPPSPRHIPKVTPKPPEGAIFDANAHSNMLVSDFRARNIGDVLTILIEENLKASKDVKTKTDRKSDYNLGLTGILGLQFEESMQPHFDGTVNATKAIGGNVQDKFSGSGATSNGTMLAGTVSARVVQVLPGGNLLIEGSRELNVNNETQYIILTGIVRPKDISRDNTVSSTKIADARLSYTGAGQLSEKQHEGWMQRILGIVAPF